MHRYEATIRWQNDGGNFIDNRYSRGHQWEFDGGARIAASSAPSSVPLPMSVAENVDPEEALVAATSSCHMLWFLSVAARAGFAVAAYRDQAFGIMDRNGDGKLAITRIVLRPQIEFSGTAPDAEKLAQMHEKAHANCFIANSIKADITVEAP